MVTVTFSTSTFDGLELSSGVLVTVVLSGGVVSSTDINVPVSFTPATALGSYLAIYVVL